MLEGEGGENVKLYDKLEKTIIESGASYGEAMSAVKRLLAVYTVKGENLLNSVTIQEVSNRCESSFPGRLPEARGAP